MLRPFWVITCRMCYKCYYSWPNNILGPNLKWDEHICRVLKKANSRFYAMRKLRPFLNTHELHELYTGFIRPVLEYGCPVFVGLHKKLSSRLISVDKRAHWIIFRECDRDCSCHVNEMTTRRHEISKKLYHMIEMNKNHILHNIIPRRLPRTNRPLIPFCRTEKASLSFVTFIARLLNDLWLLILLLYPCVYKCWQTCKMFTTCKILILSK